MIVLASVYLYFKCIVTLSPLDTVSISAVLFPQVSPELLGKLLQCFSGRNLCLPLPSLFLLIFGQDGLFLLFLKKVAYKKSQAGKSVCSLCLARCYDPLLIAWSHLIHCRCNKHSYLLAVTYVFPQQDLRKALSLTACFFSYL